MDADDLPVGRLLSRREVLVLLGGAGLAVAAGCSDSGSKDKSAATASAPHPTAGATEVHGANAGETVAAAACMVKPALTEGPFFVDEKLNRSDIRTDTKTGALREGTPLALTFVVSTAGASCAAVAGAAVYVWQCDALGVYSDVQDPSFNTKGQDYLRGYQVTDAQGRAAFQTIYPGWYQGRAVHIHFKIRTEPQAQAGTEFTSQLFFDDALTDQVHAAAPYAQKGTAGRTMNAQDSIFQGSDGQLTLAPTKDGDGYGATFALGLQA